MSPVASLEESGAATWDPRPLKERGKDSGICLEESWVNPRIQCGHEIRKNISGSYLGGVWGCYLGSEVSTEELIIVWDVPGRSLG